MKAITFPQANCKMGPPKGHTEDECSTIDVYKGPATNQGNVEIPVVISCWELNPDEIATIIKEKKLYIYVWGTGMPPISATPYNPFKQITFLEAVERSEMTDEQKAFWRDEVAQDPECREANGLPPK